MLRDKLNRLSQHLGTQPGSDDKTIGSDRYDTLSDFLGGKVVRRDEGNFVKIETDFDESYVHGSYALYEMDRNIDYLFRHFSEAEPGESISKENLLTL